MAYCYHLVALLDERGKVFLSMIFVQRKSMLVFCLLCGEMREYLLFVSIKSRNLVFFKKKNLIFLTFWFFYVIMEVSRKTM